MKLHNFYSNRFSILDFLCIQEHKLQSNKLLALSSQVWPGAQFFHCDASTAYNHTIGEPGVGSGGICTFVSPRLQILIHSSGTTWGNRAQWILLKGFPGGDLGIINVYAPYSPVAKMHLWKELTLFSTSYKWII
jgi:hypothetical protein